MLSLPCVVGLQSRSPVLDTLCTDRRYVMSHPPCGLGRALVNEPPGGCEGVHLIEVTSLVSGRAGTSGLSLCLPPSPHPTACLVSLCWVTTGDTQVGQTAVTAAGEMRENTRVQQGNTLVFSGAQSRGHGGSLCPQEVCSCLPRFRTWASALLSHQQPFLLWVYKIAALFIVAAVLV